MSPPLKYSGNKLKAIKLIGSSTLTITTTLDRIKRAGMSLALYLYLLFHHIKEEKAVECRFSFPSLFTISIIFKIATGSFGYCLG